jgi:hypothetical protein
MRGERVRGINHAIDAALDQKSGEAAGAPEPADPDFAGWQSRNPRPSCK